jgi:uncharacterized protein
MIIERLQEKILVKNITKQKVTILLGARRVGKTSLLKKIFSKYDGEKLWLNGEDSDVKKIVENRSVTNYKNLLGKATLLIIDEAQHITEIGSAVKLMIDEITPLHIIITGSLAFDIAQSGYPLAGRSITNYLYPIAQAELNTQENILQTQQQLENKIIYGSYPEVFSFATNEEKQLYLSELVNTYLLKDILEFENIRNVAAIKKLLALIALQIGHEVSETELAVSLGISKNTVAKYLDLLEKVFVLYPLSGYSNNLRKEVSKTKKWFFYDTGVRNAIIKNYAPLILRQDVGQLWENYLLTERKKINTYLNSNSQHFFWRTYDRQEIDLIEVLNGKLHAFEIKWNSTKAKIPIGFKAAYPSAGFTIINKDNYLDWLK